MAKLAIGPGEDHRDLASLPSEAHIFEPCAASLSAISRAASARGVAHEALLVAGVEVHAG